MKKRFKTLLCILLSLVFLFSLSSCGVGEVLPDEKKEIKQASYDEQALNFDGIVSARQLGGYITESGKTTKYGMLIRCGSLANSSESDIDKIKNEFSINRIFDLRLSSEKRNAKDPQIDGIEYVELDVFAGAYTSEELDKKAELRKVPKDTPDTANVSVVLCQDTEYVEDVCSTLLRIASSEGSQKVYAEMFDEILEANGVPLLWHDSTGKDRVGLASILILAALNLDEGTIKEDFLRTNIYYEEDLDIALAIGQGQDYTDRQLDGIRCTVAVSEEVFDSLMQMINNRYGGLHSYLNNQIGVSDEEMLQLQEYYCE